MTRPRRLQLWCECSLHAEDHRGSLFGKLGCLRKRETSSRPSLGGSKTHARRLSRSTKAGGGKASRPRSPLERYAIITEPKGLAGAESLCTTRPRGRQLCASIACTPRTTAGLPLAGWEMSGKRRLPRDLLRGGGKRMLGGDFGTLPRGGYGGASRPRSPSERTRHRGAE